MYNYSLKKENIYEIKHSQIKLVLVLNTLFLFLLHQLLKRRSITGEIRIQFFLIILKLAPNVNLVNYLVIIGLKILIDFKINAI